MKERIEVVFTIDRNGKDLFYVEYNQNCFHTTKPELDPDLIKATLDCDDSALEYIKSKFNEWRKNYAIRL